MSTFMNGYTKVTYEMKDLSPTVPQMKHRGTMLSETSQVPKVVQHSKQALDLKSTDVLKKRVECLLPRS